MTAALLAIEDLRVDFPIRTGLFGRAAGAIRAVDGVSLSLDAGETLGLVGESGCGKSTLANAVLRVVRPSAGRILFRAADTAALDDAGLRAMRRRIQMIFQDPFAALNPKMTVGESVGEPLLVHGLKRGAALSEATAELFRRVGLAPDHRDRYPHEFSGGQILNLLLTLQRDLGTAYLFISHDLSVVRHVSDRIAVMYLGQIVEIGPRDALFGRPLHPYTQALISAIPIPDPPAQRAQRRIILAGEIPSPANPPGGCRFHTRCPIAQDICRREVPVLAPKSSGSQVACHFAT